MTGIDADHMHEVLPQVVETIEKYADLDPTHDFVPVKPTAHYTMGGIPITTDGEVYRWQNDERNVVEGLFAAGECACVSCTAQTSRRQFPAGCMPVRHPLRQGAGGTHFQRSSERSHG